MRIKPTKPFDKNMKCNAGILKWLPAALCSVALSITALADHTVATFDTDLTVNGTTDNLRTGDTPSPSLLVWTNTGTPGGSMYVVINWGSQGGWQDTKVQADMNPWPGYDLRQYLYLEFDVLILTNLSQPDAAGNYGNLQIVCQGWDGAGDNSGNGGYNQLGYLTLTPTNNWQHFKVSTATFPHLLNRLTFNFNVNPNQTNATQIHYLVDNVVLTSPPVPPPTLGTVKPATPAGLTLIPGAGSEWQRVMIYPNGTDFGWFNRGNPVTYSFTVKDFPKVSEFAANIFLVPNGHMPYGAGDTAIDWNATNTLVLNFTANGSNPATSWNVGFNAKTNLGGGNPNFNNLANFNYTQFPTGTWSLTFNNNTNFTITAPNGFSTNANIPEAVADLVSGNSIGNTALTPYFGIMPRVTTANIGFPTVFSRIQVTGVSSPVDDEFSTAPLNGGTWSRLADYQPGIFVDTNDVFKYVTWNIPNDQGYGSLLAASNPAGPYKEIGATSAKWLNINGTRTGIVPKSGINAALGGAENTAAYFRLIRRGFAKLQVLMPGETAAPGTVSGKTGTPTAQGVGVPFSVRINAVDEIWNVVSSGDTVHIACTDGTATLPGDTALAGGTANVIVTFNAAGTFTVTASDVTDGSKTPDTGSPTDAN
jgi:hypothetical protein